MTSTRVVVSAALVFATALTTQALMQAPQTPATPPAAPQAPAPAGAPPAGRARPGPARRGQGRGGGRGNPMAALYTERCSGCHGVDMSGGRAPSLFDDTWIHGSDDESIAKVITNGVPNTEMMPFKDQLTEPQIWQLVAYLKTQAANLKEKPVYVPGSRRHGDQDREADLQDRDRRARARDALGHRVPARRTPPHHRAARPAAHRRRRASCCRRRSPARRRSGSARTAASSTSRSTRSTPQNGWIYLSYSEPGPNNTAPPSRPRRLPRA